MTQKILFILAFVLTMNLHCAALPLEHYAEQSALSSGKWVKIKLDKTGLYRITTSELKKMGFSDPSRVRVHGYGGYRQPDLLIAENYIDDLPQLQSINDANGVIFYGQGPYTRQQYVSYDKMLTHTPSVYSQYSYYFLTESDTDLPPIEETGTPGASSPATTFLDVVHHEQELMSPAEAGTQLLGEDFRFTPSRTLTFQTPDAVDGAEGWFECSFASEVFGAASTLT
ncbi:MAG: hypothetical protein K2H03_08010, partial [Muribaculaceae bacterium]|nr:hypothetical protein [Muribaculaceae bacterium]